MKPNPNSDSAFRFLATLEKSPVAMDMKQAQPATSSQDEKASTEVVTQCLEPSDREIKWRQWMLTARGLTAAKIFMKKGRRDFDGQYSLKLEWVIISADKFVDKSGKVLFNHREDLPFCTSGRKANQFKPLTGPGFGNSHGSVGDVELGTVAESRIAKLPGLTPNRKK